MSDDKEIISIPLYTITNKLYSKMPSLSTPVIFILLYAWVYNMVCFFKRTNLFDKMVIAAKNEKLKVIDGKYSK